MKIGLQTWGTDGDIRPFIALAGGLSAKGHDVTLAITNFEKKDYTAHGDALGFKIIHACNTYRDWNAETLANTLTAILSESPVKQVIGVFEKLVEPAVDEMYDTAKILCAENDILIGHFSVHPLRLAVEKANKPFATVVLHPNSMPSRYKTPTGLPYLGDWMNSVWWKLIRKMLNKSVLPFVNRLRQREGSPPASDVVSDVWQSETLTLVGASPAIYERPSDWRDTIQLCGFFDLPEKSEEWVMPENLKRFLDKGEAPVYMTFGSLTPAAPLEVAKLFAEAAKLAGCRAIIQCPATVIPDAPVHPDIYYTDKTPHHKVFPRCALVVHHGGAGTSHSASLSGCPSVVVEHFGDQRFWGTQLVRLGLAKKLLHKRTVTAKILADEIRNVRSSAAIKLRASQIGDAMKKENGVARAVELVEQHLGSRSLQS